MVLIKISTRFFSFRPRSKPSSQRHLFCRFLQGNQWHTHQGNLPKPWRSPQLTWNKEFGFLSQSGIFTDSLAAPWPRLDLVGCVFTLYRPRPCNCFVFYGLAWPSCKEMIRILHWWSQKSLLLTRMLGVSAQRCGLSASKGGAQLWGMTAQESFCSWGIM
jgi:hypothetical protein